MLIGNIDDYGYLKAASRNCPLPPASRPKKSFRPEVIQTFEPGGVGAPICANAHAANVPRGLEKTSNSASSMNSWKPWQKAISEIARAWAIGRRSPIRLERIAGSSRGLDAPSFPITINTFFRKFSFNESVTISPSPPITSTFPICACSNTYKD